MDEPDFTPFADKVGKYAKERTLADIQVLYVGSPDPKMFFTFATRAMTSWKCASSAMYCIILITVNL